MRDAAHVVRPERGGDGRFILEQNPREQLEIQIALRLLEKDRTSPSVLARLAFFEVPVGALDQANGEARSARATPLEEIEQIVIRIPQISVNDTSTARPLATFSLSTE